jgi:asparagine synthase (glutamine-hydrolysing)
LEGREPLLDHRIIEFVAQLPSNMKIKNGNKKWLLKEITHKYLPKKMMNRDKKGFGVPIQELLKDNLKEYFEEYINEKTLNQHGLFNTHEVIDLKKKYINDSNIKVTKLWYILIFQMWYKKWMQ